MMAAEGSRPTPTRQFSSLQYPVPGSSSSTSAQADSSGASALNSTNNPRRTSWGRSPYSQEPPPVEPSPGSLDEFRQHCSSFYYEGDDAAGKHVEQTLRQVPHLQRKTYTTIQAATRAQFHVDTAHAKRHALEDVLRRALPGNDIGSDLGLGRASPIRDWRSPAARQARYCELRTFVNDHALKNYPGPHPFLKTLKAVLLLQALALKQGGAGAMRLEWEIDDAVWLESGGDDFTRAGIHLLVGVLGFEEVHKEIAPTLSRQTSIASTASYAISEVQQVQHLHKKPPHVPPHRLTGTGSRAQVDRIPSDPFVDNSSSDLSCGSTSLIPPPSPISPAASKATPRVAHAHHYIRTFVAPAYLTNPELQQLSYALPHWLREPARFSTRSRSVPPDLEDGLAELRIGSHLIRVSLRPRDAGYGGSFMERLSAWFSSFIN